MAAAQPDGLYNFVSRLVRSAATEVCEGTGAAAATSPGTAGGWGAPGTIPFGDTPARYGLSIANASGVKSNGPDLLKYSVSLHSSSPAPYARCQPPGIAGLPGCWQRTDEETFVLSGPWQIKAAVSGYLLLEVWMVEVQRRDLFGVGLRCFPRAWSKRGGKTSSANELMSLNTALQPRAEFPYAFCANK